MRPGEYLAPRWQDVDLKAGRASVVRALVRVGRAWDFEEVKTANSRRSVPFPAELAGRLTTHRREQLERRVAMGPGWEDNDLVFCGQRGQPLDERNLHRPHFKAALTAARLPAERIRLYDLRHTCATLLLQEGHAPKVVSERLGHASSAFTQDVYAHVLPTMQQAASDTLGALLFRPRAESRGRAPRKPR